MTGSPIPAAAADPRAAFPGGNSTAIPVGAMPQEAGAASQFFPFFTPSFDLALIGAVVGAAMVFIHLGLVIRTKAFYFGPVIVPATLMFAVGMTSRLIVIVTPSMSNAFIVSSFVLMVTSAILSTALVFTYTRLMWWVTPPEYRNISNLWLPPRATSFILVLAAAVGDVVSTIGSGQLIKPAPPRLQATGAVIKMLVWIFTFGLVARLTLISRRWRMDPDTRRGSLELGLALTAATFLLSILGIMNVLEKDALESLIKNRRPSSILTTEEWPVWVFNFAPTILIFGVMAAYHPGDYLPRRLTGLRLKGNELVAMDVLRDEENVGAATMKNGWIIGRPRPVGDDDENMKGDVFERKMSVGYAR
ncbi:hypothetical protein F5X68DRAFT_227120 [Plectosphaerella plurivora]|uniref:Uncharacterized protein n=1 Tax=Plectosphaerella plurivora TaxID=936078 RepID=A0A9P8VIW0_9PEZI|nr:hypothetical protein F5X68DRAFT_227120 [Plectosphaerella plurivora]